MRHRLTIGMAFLSSIIATLSLAPVALAATCAQGGPCALGDIGPGGGIVFMTPNTSGNTTSKFFEAAPNTWGGSSPDKTLQWCNAGTSVSGLITSIGSGQSNTSTLASTCTSTGTNNAASYVSSQTIGGLSDWFIGSKDEMLELYAQRALLSGSYATNQADADAARYLTSNQGTNAVNALGAYMEASSFPGTTQDVSKSFSFSVRPMRMFSAAIASSITSSPSITFSLSFSGDGTCSTTFVSALQGQWVSLPGSASCQMSPESPHAQLLGWATSPTFPVNIAKRQVDNRWGAYETFDSGGRLSGVFIPAGGYAHLSSNNTLYQIWSN